MKASPRSGASMQHSFVSWRTWAVVYSPSGASMQHSFCVSALLVPLFLSFSKVLCLAENVVPFKKHKFKQSN